MTQRPETLQGTDGIRGRVSTDQSLTNRSPLTILQQEGLLTPPFFELYTYAFAKHLLNTGFAQKGDSVVIGWDPRDREGIFNQAAIAGIRKAGLNAIVTGILPTPAVPLYMLSMDAAGAVVLTASHNPSDQNGIKLFYGATGLKFLPADDKALTQLIYNFDESGLKNLDLIGDLHDHSASAKTFFIDYCTNPDNSWIKDENFSDTTLFIDASKGATAEVVEAIFSRFEFGEVIYTNMDGNINENCGVADIEGIEEIKSADVVSENGKFHHYSLLQKIFDKAAKNDLESPLKIVGLVFDGDGDRCYRLDYLPEKNAVLVSSGDFLGVHQASFISQQENGENLLFVNTVESDLNTAIAARQKGFTTILTGVGDKWILLKAVLDLMETYFTGTPTFEAELKSLLKRREKGEEISGFEISKLWRDYLTSQPSLPAKKEGRFRIGIEESGHAITPGYITKNKVQLPCFAGNGIKSGLNALKAVSTLYSNQNRSQNLISPFPSGVNKTFYTYYVDKSRILPGHRFREQISAAISDHFYHYFSKEYAFQFLVFPEEKPMLYCSISRDGNQCAAIFMRNSGTEDKSALYLRGETALGSALESFGEELHLIILLGQKEQTNPFCQFETDLLKRIDQKENLHEISTQYPNLPVNRILKEIEFKEGLIIRSDKGYQLSNKGNQFLQMLRK